MSLHKHAQNAATIRVTYPDGCKANWQTRRDAPLARDSAAFARWLIETGESILEAATTEGMCKKK